MGEALPGALNQNSATLSHGVGRAFCGLPDRGSGPDEHGIILKYLAPDRIYVEAEGKSEDNEMRTSAFFV